MEKQSVAVYTKDQNNISEFSINQVTSRANITFSQQVDAIRASFTRTITFHVSLVNYRNILQTRRYFRILLYS